MTGGARNASLILAAAAITFATPAFADVDQLRALVAMKAGVVDLLHTKAERALVTAAQDETFRRYFEAKTDAERAELRERIDHISLAVQSKFHVEEMCLIDPTGTEISRVVQGKIAYDLSTEEASADFFAPTFAKEPRQVFLASIYISPDVHRWVTAYATPVVVKGNKEAILHYEHGLDFYERALTAGIDPTGSRVLLAAARGGWVIIDTRKNIPIEQVGDSEDPAAYFEQLAVGGMSLDEIKDLLGGAEEGAGTIAGSDGNSLDVAYKTVGEWTLVAFEPNNDQPS